MNTQSPLDLILGNVLERRQHRSLHLSLDGHLDNTSRILSQFCRDQLENLFLAHEIGGLFVGTCILEALV